MSYLSLPRVAFAAMDASVNTSTANNDLIADICDFHEPRLINTGAKDPAQVRNWLMEIVNLHGMNPDPMLAMRGWWNYYGDHATTLGSSTVKTISPIAGQPAPPSSDPMQGATVTMTAVMADLNPADCYNSLIFCSPFQVFGTVAGETVALIRGIQPTAAPSRWLNDNRPYGAATFQCVVPKAQLTFAEPGMSATVDALAQEIGQNAAGLVIRYCLFGFQYKLPAKEVRERFLHGDFISNPKFGHVVGSFQPWYENDLKSGATGRVLYPQPSPYGGPAPAWGPSAGTPRTPAIKTHEDLARRWYPQPGAQPMGALTANPFIAGPAVAEVDRSRGVVILDLLSSYPIAPTGLQLDLTYADGSGTEQRATVAQFFWDPASYAAQGGILEVPYPAALDPLLDGGLLSLSAPGTPVGASFAETPLAQVETDDRCIYMQEGETRTLQFRVLAKGLPIQEPLTLTVQQWNDAIKPGESGTGNPPIARIKTFYFTYQPPTDSFAAVPPTLDVPAGGVANLRVVGRVPGCFKVRLIPPGATVNQEPDFTVEYFANIRVLPRDDFSQVPDEVVRSWPYIYENVFKYYSLLYPVMSKFIPWGPQDAPDDPAIVARFAEQIKYYTGTELLTSPMYMPVTRELSNGKRALLHRWCDLNLAAARGHMS